MIWHKKNPGLGPKGRSPREDYNDPAFQCLRVSQRASSCPPEKCTEVYFLSPPQKPGTLPCPLVLQTVLCPENSNTPVCRKDMNRELPLMKLFVRTRRPLDSSGTMMPKGSQESIHNGSLHSKPSWEDLKILQGSISEQQMAGNFF